MRETNPEYKQHICISYNIFIYIYTLWTLEKIRGSTRISRQNETEWGKRSSEKYNRFLKRRNKEEIQWQIDLFESEKCKRKLKTTKPKINKQLDQNYRITTKSSWNPHYFGTFATTEAPYTKKSS